MDNRYISLFKIIIRSAEDLCKKVSESNYNGKNDQTDNAARTMTQDFHNLYDKNPSTYTRADFARLLVGASIVITSLENQSKQLTDAIANYKNNVLPNLRRVFEESTDDETALSKAEELFTIKEENNN